MTSLKKEVILSPSQEAVLNTYWKFRLWLIEMAGRWSQFKFNCAQRWKSTKYSISVLKWHKPCIECWGSKTSVKYWQEQPCRLGCGVGYQKIHFWMDMKDIFYPSQKIYDFKQWFKRTVYGCSHRHPLVWHQYCRYGTCGCQNHSLDHDWQGKPLDELTQK